MQGGKTGALDHAQKHDTHTHTHAKNHLDAGAEALLPPLASRAAHSPSGLVLAGKASKLGKLGAKERLRGRSKDADRGRTPLLLGHPPPDHRSASDRELFGRASVELEEYVRYTLENLQNGSLVPPDLATTGSDSEPQVCPRLLFKHLMGTSRNTNVLPRFVPQWPLAPPRGASLHTSCTCHVTMCLCLHSRTTCRGH